MPIGRAMLANGHVRHNGGAVGPILPAPPASEASPAVTSLVAGLGGLLVSWVPLLRQSSGWILRSRTTSAVRRAHHADDHAAQHVRRQPAADGRADLAADDRADGDQARRPSSRRRRPR